MGLLFMLALHTSHYKDYNINSCYLQSETSLNLTSWDACSSRCSQTKCRSHECHTAFTVGHFHFQHPCMFLFRLLDKSNSPKSS